ncbi:MAG: hypothetical protein Q8Q39_01935 [bacterium]|nr:hypothetical protein [bacterium]
MNIWKRLFPRRRGKAGSGLVFALEPDAVSVAFLSALGGDARITHVERLFAAQAQGARNDSGIVAEGELERLVSALCQKRGMSMDASYVIAGLDGSLVQSSMFRAVFEREHPKEKIGEAELRSMLEKAERSLRSDIESRVSRTMERGLHLIDSTLEEVLLDGYAVPNPIGLVGKEIEIALFNTYTDTTMMEFLRHLQKAFGASKLFTATTPYALCRAYMRSATSPFSGIFVGVGEAATSVSIVAQGRFLGTKTFSIGRGIFVRSIAEHLRLGGTQAEDLMRQYADGTISKHVERRISNLLLRASSVWGSGVELALDEFRGACELFPSAFYLHGVDTGLKDLAAVLEDAKRFGGYPFLEKRSVCLLDSAPLTFASEILSADTAEVSRGSCPEVMALAYIFLKDKQPSGELTKIVQQVSKLAYT